MCVELIDDKDPTTVGICLDRLFDVSGKILFISGMANGRRDDLAGCHIEVGGKTLCAIADVFELDTLRLSRRQRQGGMGTLQSLNSGLLIGTDGVDSLFPELLSLPVNPTDGIDGFVKCFRVFFPFVGEPVSEPVWLEVCLIKKNDRLCGEKCFGQSLFS